MTTKDTDLCLCSPIQQCILKIIQLCPSRKMAIDFDNVQSRTAFKGTLADRSDTVRQTECDHTGTVLEGSCTDCDHTAGNRHVLQNGTAAKGLFLNFFNGVRYGNPLQAGTMEESPLSDARYFAWNHDFF